MATPFVPQPGSRLLGLPGELRNKIIRNMFKYEDRILLTPYIGPVVHPSSPAMSCVILDIRIFTTCRQLLGECKSIFLSENTFLLSMHSNTFKDASSMGLLSRWMFDLGPYRDYVRKVIIDLSPLCPGPCHLSKWWVDLKPIIIEIWRFQDILTGSGNRQRANIDISFAFSGRQLHGHAHHPPRSISEFNLNAMITLLNPQRSPGMSPYLQSPRVLREIQAAINIPAAVFVLGTPNHRDYTDSPVISYYVNSNGLLKRRFPNPNKGVGIVRLTSAASIRETLLPMLMCPNITQLTYNIDTRTISHRFSEPFSINRHFRKLALEKYSGVHVVGSLTSYSAHATSTDLRSMQDWCMASQLFISGKRGIRQEKNPPTILMRFELSEREDLPNLRIPITNIIVATTNLPPNTELRVELVRLDLSIRIKVAVKSASLYRLQQRFLIFLADILDFHPGQGAQVCPEVMMNGNFVVEEAECERENGSKFVVRNEYPNTNSDDLEDEIDLCINKLIEQADPVTAAYLPPIEVSEEGTYLSYDLDAPHDPSLRGVAVWLACCLQEAAATVGG